MALTFMHNLNQQTNTIYFIDNNVLKITKSYKFRSEMVTHQGVK